jgi:hypothetical protein
MFGQGGVPVPGDSGTFSQFGISTAHDNSVGWTTELDTAVGYDFNRAFSVRAGIPFYLVNGKTTTTTSTDTTTTTQQYNSVGDAFIGLSLHPQFEKYAFALGLVGTAPTGSRTNGISTGRATATVSGRAETYISRFTPFVEGTFGNSLTNTTRYNRPFTTLGTVSTWTGGTGIDLTKKVSFEASAFYVQPFGDQKIYSHNMGGAMGAGSGMGGSMGGSNGKRPFEQAAMTSGTASIAKDHGFSGDLGFSPTRRVSVDVAYTRSIAYALDTYSAGLSFRLGHLPGKKF